jgi:hypothetical protein
VNAGQAPLTVNAEAGKATNLDADKLDGKDSTEFAPSVHPHAGEDITSGTVADDRTAATVARDSEVMPIVQDGDGAGSNLDADTVDGTDSADFIQRNPSVAQNGSIDIDGTMRTSGMLRTGSETGTSEPPEVNVPDGHNGLVVRRINSTVISAGSVLARTDELRLELDGSPGGLRIAWGPDTASSANTVNCMGINSGGAAVNHYSEPVTGSVGTAPVFTDAQDVVYATCSFGNSFNNRHVTQVTLQRKSGDNFWVGSVTSTFNQ